MEKLEKAIERLFFNTMITVSVIILMMYPVTWLWNGVMPTLFGLQVIEPGMALKINMLSTILFGSKLGNLIKD